MLEYLVFYKQSKQHNNFMQHMHIRIPSCNGYFSRVGWENLVVHQDSIF